MMWSGIYFDVVDKVAGGKCWVSQYEEHWKATQYEPGGPWFARVKVTGCYRFAGQGKTPQKALDAALKEARRVLDSLRTGLPK
jgi:hypothetical protein